MSPRQAVGLVALAAVTVGGCMPASYRQARRLEGRYEVGDPGAGWSRVAPGGADHAWFNDALGATIYTDSNCGPRYQDLRATDLATELEAGLAERVTERDEARVVMDREAVLRVHQGTIDGVPVRIATLVVNRDACTYDALFIAPPEGFEAGWPAYESVIDGLRAR